MIRFKQLKPKSRLINLALVFFGFMNVADLLGATCTANTGTLNWSSLSTWPCGHLPVSGDVVIIPAGSTITMDANQGIAIDLDIFGTLKFANGSFLSPKNLTISSANMVNIYPGGSITGGNTYSNLYAAVFVAGIPIPFTGPTFYSGTFTSLAGPQTCTSSAGCVPNVSLPITLEKFTASYESQNSRVRLNWSTVRETDNDHFTIERSVDAFSFQEIITLPGAGNSQERLAYVTYDDNPLRGMSYYRLKQTDYNGQHHYSKPLSIRSPQEMIWDVSLAPNPFDGQQLSIHFNEGSREEVQLSVYDQVGQKVGEGHYAVETGQKTAIRLERSLPEGVYFIKLGQGSKEITRKIMVSR